MCFKDGQFARHHRFRYYVHNMLQRHRANQTGRVFVKRNEEERGLSLEELRESLNAGNKAIEHGLLHFDANIKGTMHRKISKRMELYDMVEFLGFPTFFVKVLAHLTTIQ